MSAVADETIAELRRDRALTKRAIFWMNVCRWWSGFSAGAGTAFAAVQFFSRDGDITLGIAVCSLTIVVATSLRGIGHRVERREEARWDEEVSTS